MNILEVNSLKKHYNNFDLEDVSFSIPEGTIMGLIGENGAGKSTVINIIIGAVNKDEGRVAIFDKDTKNTDYTIRNDIGTVLAGCGFPEELCASDTNGILKSIYSNWNEKKFFDSLSKFSLDKKKKIKDYSTGMKMKLELAVALSHSAKLLILDEVTNGLDPMARNEILDILLDFIQDEKCGVLISSHIIGDLEKICDYITFIHEGKLVFSEEKDELLEKYAVINVDEQKLSELDEKAVVSLDKTKFSSKALVIKNMIPRDFEVEKTSIEDIMLFYMKRGADK
ncbi:ABC transporter ATP-binding protein YtrB [bioreactor metagenome]|uniref:ABC transporter ATP-binding protein YtrB n=1 Tax=bioreactor metagenome TaxID=1076179 RepID=A0A644ZA01_9ZZZZ|nr:ABC transporter ATP-binding protein [Candidatus Metalachnospira sp.]